MKNMIKFKEKKKLLAELLEWTDTEKVVASTNPTVRQSARSYMITKGNGIEELLRDTKTQRTSRTEMLNEP